VVVLFLSCPAAKARDLEAQKQKKNTFFEKRSGEVTDNKLSPPKNEPERTEKRS
jgi:hypothetical protein